MGLLRFPETGQVQIETLRAVNHSNKAVTVFRVQ